jgi:hypothetical protein
MAAVCPPSWADFSRPRSSGYGCRAKILPKPILSFGLKGCESIDSGLQKDIALLAASTVAMSQRDPNHPEAAGDHRRLRVREYSLAVTARLNFPEAAFRKASRLLVQSKRCLPQTNFYGVLGISSRGVYGQATFKICRLVLHAYCYDFDFMER